uniref:NADH dehydrogenase subunit 6 n=1 Tax=Heligmosomoides polygyrus TaxID=6339 RepID=A0A183GRL9_HELPZ
MVFLLVSLFGGLISYICIDPMKSRFFLILSILMLIPLLFLRGIFVILVYFSSLSKFNTIKVYIILLVVFLTIYFCYVRINMGVTRVGLNVFYYSINWLILVYILLVLLFFINFTSYFLSFSGALRKV